jgi:Carboxypeptidase regulatory-like domain
MRTTVVGRCVGVGQLVVASSTVWAQVGTGTVTGIVTDAGGSVVPGALVTATHVETAGSRPTVSSSAGIYTIAGLPPGEYRIDVALSGFRPTRREGVRLETGETIRLDFAFTVGDASETVTVSGDAPVLRSTASLGEVVSEEKIVALPLNGRSFITLASLAPGVALPPGSQLPRINGGRPRTNEYLFDGISVLQPEPGQVAFFPVVDAIQEFKIETNSPPAEFGRFNGGVVNLTTRSGTNAFHGTAFRIPSQRGAERAQLLRRRKRAQAGVPPESVRRRAGWADQA